MTKEAEQLKTSILDLGKYILSLRGKIDPELFCEMSKGFLDLKDLYLYGHLQFTKREIYYNVWHDQIL